jgi:hypothetical protein
MKKVTPETKRYIEEMMRDWDRTHHRLQELEYSAYCLRQESKRELSAATMRDLAKIHLHLTKAIDALDRVKPELDSI